VHQGFNFAPSAFFNSLGNPPLQPAHPLDNFAPHDGEPDIGMVW